MAFDPVIQLALYNGALTLCDERTLANLTENRKPRFLLDQAWTDGPGGALRGALEEGQWKFATRTQKYTYSPSITPPFGYQFAFNKPDDFVKTVAVCTDAHFNNPLTQYDDESGFWFSDFQTLFIKYISDDPSFGLNYSLWPQSYVYFFHAFLAKKIIGSLTQEKDKKDDMNETYKKFRLEARSKDAWGSPAKFMPQGAWAGSRFGRMSVGSRRNGGNC